MNDASPSDGFLLHQQFMQATLYSQLHRLPNHGRTQIEEGWRSEPTPPMEEVLAQQFERAIQYQAAQLQDQPIARWKDANNQFDAHMGGSLGRIFLSAGADSEENRCTPKEDGACDLFQIYFRFKSNYGLLLKTPEIELVHAERLFSSFVGQGGKRYGHVQPAVSPDGSRLAFLTRAYGGDSRLRAHDFSTGKTGLLRKDTDTKSKAQFPNWYNNNYLLYHQGDEGEKHLSCMQISGNPPQAVGGGPLMGFGTATHPNRTMQDANTAADGRIVSFGSDTTPEGYRDKLTPLVHDIYGGNFEEFNLGIHVMNSAKISACHHPAWNPTATRIACSEQTSFDTDNDELQYRLLYEYEYLYRDSKWHQTQNGWALDLGNPPIDKFPDPIHSLSNCTIFTLKYAEWCGDNRVMIVTLYCEDGNSNISRSRVYLAYRNSSFVEHISFIEDNLQWIDLTGFLADAFGENNQTYNGVYGTCSV